MSVDAASGPGRLPDRGGDVDLEQLADALRDLADEVEPHDWMHDRRGRPL